MKESVITETADETHTLSVAGETDADCAEVSDGAVQGTPEGKRLPRLNFRPMLFCAFGLFYGILLYSRLRFGGFAASDFIFIAVMFFVGLRPFVWKRVLAVLLCFTVSMGVGALAVHIYSAQYEKSAASGTYAVSGTVDSFSVDGTTVSVLLTDLALDGECVGGKLAATVDSDQVRTGDTLKFSAYVERLELPEDDSYSQYLFVNDVRYRTQNVSAEVTGASYNLLLRLNARLYDVLHGNMAKNEADISYALLTGNSGSVDGTLMQAIREGGIAHIFAVSGLHVGILYGAVSFIFSPLLKRKSFLPAIALSVCYAAFCGFSVSAVRAVIMCGAFSLNRIFGRKTDFLNAISFAAILVLLFMPAQFLSAGFRLSFGACFGLALFSGSFNRLFRRLPAFLGKYLAANLSVQIFTFPILLETFGYYSLWGTLLNFVAVPLLPVLFLGLLLCSIFALVIPPAAAVFLFFPQSTVSAFLSVFSFADFSCVLTGFSLGGGAAVWITASVTLSQHVRMKTVLRTVLTSLGCLLFAFCLIYENAVFYGCKIVVYEEGPACAALIRTCDCAVLLIDGDISLKRCKQFLARTYGGELTAVAVIAADELDGINVAAFLPVGTVYSRIEIPTGLRETNVVFGETFSVNGMAFRYESAEKITLSAQGSVVEFDFENNSALGADLFIGKGSGGLKYFLNRGIIRTV